MDVAGVAALFIAGGHVLWTIRGHREQASATIRAGKGWAVTHRPSLEVEVVNCGRCRVFLREVVLRSSRAPDKRGVRFVPNDSDVQSGIEPGDRRRYGFPVEEIPQRYKDSHPRDVWVAVESNKRELCRIDGVEVMRALDEALSSKP
jgi:hypothetical protein